MKPATAAVALAIAVAFLGDRSWAQADLTQLQLEDLMNIQVTSVSKKEQKISQAAAAISVITQEDISDDPEQRIFPTFCAWCPA